MRIRIGEACDLCEECVSVCVSDTLTVDLIKVIRDTQIAFNPENCSFCESCMSVCTEEAIIVENEGVYYG